MAAAILVTKFYVPPPSAKAVPRPRLIERLNEGLAPGHKLILVSAPAGFGKSTLVSEWVADCGQSVAWLSLDEADNDPTGFLTYLVAALQTISPPIGTGTVAMLQAPQSPTAELLLTTLLNEIAAIPESFILVLDDYHRIDSESIDQSLAFLLDHLPPQMRLVIATREDPSLPLARLRARGQLTELRAADLQFTPIEVAEFLNQVMGLHLSESDITALGTRTEGWIAGLKLAALSMQGRSNTAGFIQAFTGSHRFILDYLVEEVLQQQPERIQTFLLRTSILDRMCGPLCDAILLDPSISGQETLDQLERENLFIVSLDSERRWYRYHHLFGDLLRRRLGQPQALPNFHLHASEWYEANGYLADAFYHALAAGDSERASRLAEAAWQEMEGRFQAAAWLGWVKNLPDEVVRSRPGLCVVIGRALSDVGDVDASESYLQAAEVALAQTDAQDELRSLPGTIALVRANNAQVRGELTETVKYTELSLRLAPEDDFLLHAQAAITLGFTHWATGHPESSLRALYTWMEDMRRMGKQVFAIASVFAAADMLVTLGRLGEAERALRQAIQSAAALGPEAETITAHHHLALALLAHERGDAIVAAHYLEIAADLGHRTTLVDWRYRWNLAQARLNESAGAWGTALDLLDEAGRVYVKNSIPILRPIEAQKTRIYLKQGRLDRALSWARERALSVTDEVEYLREYEYLTLARARLEERAFTGVNELLDRLLSTAEAQQRTGSVIEILLTQALIHQAQNYQAQSLAALEHALTLAKPEGYCRIFVDEGEAMRRLLLEFRSARDSQVAQPLLGYVERIVAAFSLPTGISSRLAPTNHGSVNIDPLTEREIEILRLIADGNSNAEISQRLYLALSTVKGHNLRIFSKLQVQNRTEAVARARELRLL